jgi:hypothetical protein
MNVNGDGCLSFREIYSRSKKEDDTANLGLHMRHYNKFLDTKENKLRACKLLWCGIKIGFYLNPNSIYLTRSVRGLETIINMRDPEFNQEFKRWRDSELLNYKNPDETQAEIIKKLKFFSSSWPKLLIIKKCIFVNSIKWKEESSIEG